MIIQEVNQLQQLLNSHIYDISEEQVRQLALVLDIHITKYEKSDWFVKFKMCWQDNRVEIQCLKKSNISIGYTNRSKNPNGKLKSWECCYSFAHAVSVFRDYFCRQPVMLTAPAVPARYSPALFNELFCAANKIIEHSLNAMYEQQ